MVRRKEVDMEVDVEEIKINVKLKVSPRKKRN